MPDIKNSFDLVCFGEILYDVYDDKRMLAGAPLNVASHAAKLGLKTAIISSVGSDIKSIENELKKRNITPFLQGSSYPTGEAIIKLINGKPEFEIQKDVAFDYIKESKIDFNTRYFYYGSLASRAQITRKTLLYLLKKIHSIRFYDINIRPGLKKDIVTKLLQYADIVKASEEESHLISDFSGERIITKGKKGAEYRDKSIYSATPSQVDVIDTTGCGDAFVAAFISSLARNSTRKEALRFAVEYSSVVATYKGAFKSQKD